MLQLSSGCWLTRRSNALQPIPQSAACVSSDHLARHLHIELSSTPQRFSAEMIHIHAQGGEKAHLEKLTGCCRVLILCSAGCSFVPPLRRDKFL